MPTITNANVANAIVKLVAADALPALLGNLVMGNLVNRSFEPTLAQSGDTVNVPIPPSLSANNIAAGGSVTTQNPSLGNAQIVLNTHAEATFQIPDVSKVVAVPDLLKLYMEPAIIAIAEKIESDLLGLYPLFTANSVAGAYNTAITESVIDSVETTLFNAKVPQGAKKFLVVDGSTYGTMRQIQRFSEQQTMGNGFDAIANGTFGKVKDLNVFRSQYVAVSGNNRNNLAFAENSIALVTRRLPQPLPGTGAIAEYAELGNFGMRILMSYAPNTLAQQFTVDVLYGASVIRPSHGVQVRS